MLSSLLSSSCSRSDSSASKAPRKPKSVPNLVKSAPSKPSSSRAPTSRRRTSPASRQSLIHLRWLPSRQSTKVSRVLIRQRATWVCFRALGLCRGVPVWPASGPKRRTGDRPCSLQHRGRLFTYGYFASLPCRFNGLVCSTLPFSSLLSYSHLVSVDQRTSGAPRSFSHLSHCVAGARAQNMLTEKKTAGRGCQPLSIPTHGTEPSTVDGETTPMKYTSSNMLAFWTRRKQGTQNYHKKRKRRNHIVMARSLHKNRACI